ncbi:tetratricopeptide repeat protein [Algibacter sp. PT7-4]|uniref:tetratricopeptide repeat-containing sensor histidine kinase n=1 Tax=Algibacter ulvanivorans TaxID=3400999 RepID=UPI003AAD26A7
MKVNKTSFLFFWFVSINVYCVLNHNLLSQTNNDSTLFYYKTITELKDVNYIGKSFEFFKKKADYSLSIQDSIKSAYYLELIALGQFKMGFPYESEATSINALQLLDKVLDKTKTSTAKQRLSNHLGMVYRRLEDYNNAIRYYNQALALNNNFKDKLAIITNIANTYADQELYSDAVNVLLKYYDKSSQLNNSEIKATYLDNFGYFNSKLKNNLALLNMEKALSLRLKLQDLTGLFSSYRHLAMYYLEKPNTSKAQYYINKLLEVSSKIQSPTYQLEAIELSLKLEGNSSIKKYITLNKHLASKKQLRENKFGAVKYDVAKKEALLKVNEQELLYSQLENEKQKSFKIFYLSLAIIVFILAVFVYFLLRAQHRKNKIKEVYITEKRISKKIHDEVANDVYQIMTKLQYNKTHKKEQLLDDLEIVYNKTRDISKESGTIDLVTDYKIVLNDLLLNYKTNNLTIITKGLKDVNWQNISKLKRTTIYRVLQEVMTNMKKHSQANLVSIIFKQNGKVLEISYIDNGVGANLKSLSGLKNVESRIHALKGTVIFDSKIGEGFKIKVQI